MAQRIDAAQQPEEIKLHDGRSIPNIGFGVYQMNPKQAHDSVYEALVAGYRLIDSAVMYGNEKATGEAIEKFLQDYPDVKRQDIFYTTKLPGGDLTYKLASEKIHECLQRVKQLEYIDLILIHFPSGTPETRKETYEALVDAQKEGIVKSIGVSNFNQARIEELLDAKLPLPVVNQIEISPWLQRREVMSFCRSHGIVVEAYSPLTRGEKLSDKTLVELAKRYNKTPAQVLLRWSLDYHTVPIVKSVHPNHIRSNIELDDFQLSEEDLKDLGDASSHFLSQEKWDPLSWSASHEN